MKILVSSTGTMAAMYNDGLLPVMSRAGDAQVTRASNVEWVNGRWEGRDAHTGELLCHGKTREEALKMEHAVVESRLANYA